MNNIKQIVWVCVLWIFLLTAPFAVIQVFDYRETLVKASVDCAKDGNTWDIYTDRCTSKVKPND